MSEIILGAPVVKNAYGALQQASYLFSPIIIYDLQDSISVAISVSLGEVTTTVPPMEQILTF